jgi:hypothetical protein
MAGPPLPSKEGLAQLSPEALTIYAGRSALRVLPLIANQGTFESWGSEAQQKLQVAELAAGSSILRQGDISGCLRCGYCLTRSGDSQRLILSHYGW